MNDKKLHRLLFILILPFFGNVSFAQQIEDPYFDAKLRKSNVISFGGGSSLINNDFDNPDYENSIQLGYKRFFGDYVNIGINGKKFGIKDYDFKTIGYLSFDLNLEFYILPKNRVSPFIYAGGGAITSNDFKEVNNKVQGGIGLEYLFADSFAVSANAEANYLLNQEDFTLIPELLDNSIYYNATVGLHFYFGGSNQAKTKMASHKDTGSKSIRVEKTKKTCVTWRQARRYCYNI